MTQLTAAEREFFRLVARAAFANPFSDERAAMDRCIAGADAAAPHESAVEQCLLTVAAQLTQVARRGGLRLDDYHGEDCALLSTAQLFVCYHTYAMQFDELIRTQVQTGAISCTVPFARALLATLAACGIAPALAERYLAIFYQLRRAFYFVRERLIGVSPCMKALRRALWNNVFTRNMHWYEQLRWNRMEDFSTLRLGETGTGKGACAAAIGCSGFMPFDAVRGRLVERFTTAFVALHLSQYPETLIEAELCGHRKGAFTGAIDAHVVLGCHACAAAAPARGGGCARTARIGGPHCATARGRRGRGHPR